MAYTNSQATPRSDIYALMMQAPMAGNDLFIGDQVFPVKGEDVKRGIYMKALLGNAELLNGDAKPRANGDAYQRVNRKYDTDTFDCVEYGLESVIDDAYASDVERFFNLEVTEGQLLERSLRISYESRIAAAVMNASTFNATAAAVNYTEALLSTINLPADIAGAKLRLLKNGHVPNAIIMSASVYERIKRSTLLQNQVFGVVPKNAGQYLIPSDADIANALGVDKILVGRAPKNANAKGQANSGAFIWSDAYIAVCYIAGGEYTAGGVGRTIQWTKDTTGLFTPETYRSDERRSDIIRIRQHVAEKVIDSTACELITTSFS